MLVVVVVLADVYQPEGCIINGSGSRELPAVAHFKGNDCEMQGVICM